MSLDTPADDVLRCPDLRHLPGLAPRPNPLLGQLGTACVFDGDRVALNVLSYRDGRAAAAAAAAAGAVAGVAGGKQAGGAAAAAAAIPQIAGEAASAAGPDVEALEAVAAAAAAHAPTEAAELAGQHLLRSRHGTYVELPPLPGQPLGTTRVVVPLPAFAMRAGLRDTIYYDPAEVTAAIVTTGSVVPGTNDVVAALVQRLAAYGVPDGQVRGVVVMVLVVAVWCW